MPSLEDLADHPAIIIPAYIAALLPLTVLYALDFITEKWKTVGHTRRTGRVYLFSSIPPLCFVVFYIHLQRLTKDYKEMAAAMSAAIFCMFHILRTIWGLVQLDAFKQWNKRALRCLNSMGYGVPVYKLVSKNHDGKDDDQNSSGTSTGDREDGVSGDTGICDLTRNGHEPRACIRITQTWFAKMKNLALSACNYLVFSFQRRGNIHDSDDDDHNSSGTPLESSDGLSASSTCTPDLTGNAPESETSTSSTQTRFAKVKNVAFSACSYLVSIFNRRDIYEKSEEEKLNLSEQELGTTVDKHMMVNSSLVDNEFGSAELPCRVKKVCLLRAIWGLVSRGTTFRVSDYVECELAVECSVRWLVVFVARFGSQWLTEKSDLGSLEKYNQLPFDEKKKVFRRRVGALAVLKTTFEDGGEHKSVFCPGSPLMKTPSTQEGLRLTKSERAELPYKCSGYEDDEDISFERLSSSVREVILGWDRRALSILESDERKSVEQMSSSEISCFAKMMSSSLPGSRLVTSHWLPMTIPHQIEQFDSKKDKSFNSLVPTNTTLYRRNLWSGRFENKLVDQACVHIDNWAALESGRRLNTIKSPEDICNILREGGKGTFHGHKTLEMRAYEYDLSRDETVETRAAWGIAFLGSVMESVRAFLAHSVADLADEDIGEMNWRPRMDRKKFRIQCSRQLLNCLREPSNGSGRAGTNGEQGPRAWNVETRLLWELQLSFHSAVSTRAEEDEVCRGLVELNELMVLCMLGFPCLEVSKKRHVANDKCGTATEGQETVYRSDSDTVLSMGEDGCDTERAFFIVKPVQGPQPIWLIVCVDCATGTGEVEVMVGENELTCNVFDWQAWKDSCMGRIQGQAEWRGRMVGPEGKRPREEALESILSTPIKNLPFHVKQWGGWPPFDPRMSMISTSGTFNAREHDFEHVEDAMDEAARNRISGEEEDEGSTSESRATAETLRAQAQTAKQEGRSSESLLLLCECIRAHTDLAALDEMVVLLRENGRDFVGKHRDWITGCTHEVLYSSIGSRRERNAGREGAESAAILLEKLALFCSSLHEMCPEELRFAADHTRCLFELRDPKFLPVLQEYRANMIFPEDASFLAAVFCFDQWKSSDEPHMRLLGEANLEVSALLAGDHSIALSIGYLFEKGMLRGRQTVHLEELRWKRLSPDISIQQTACHFVAHSPDSLDVVCKGTATAVRIYERYIEGYGGSRVLNRLGLVYLLGGLQDLERSEALLNRAKREYSIDAMCNLAVLHGFQRGKWDLAEQNLSSATLHTDSITDSDKTVASDRLEEPVNSVTDSDTPLRSHGFRRPVPENVSINGNVYKIWNYSDICHDPHTSSMNNLAVLYEMEDNSFGDVQQALELYEKILVIDENPVALLNMIVLLKLGPASVRDEIRSQSLLRTLQSRLPDNEHMPALAKSVRQLGTHSSSEVEQKWSLALDELDDCAVFVKQLEGQSGHDEST